MDRSRRQVAFATFPILAVLAAVVVVATPAATVQRGGSGANHETNRGAANKSSHLRLCAGGKRRSHLSASSKVQRKPAAAATRLESRAIMLARAKGSNRVTARCTVGAYSLSARVRSRSLVGKNTLGSAYSTSTAADSYVSQVNPDTVHGSYSYLRVLGSSGTNRNAYLRFDLGGLSGSVTQATLNLYPTTGSSSGFDVHAEPDNGWQESSLTWNNAPAFAGAVSASSGPVSAGVWDSVDVTPLVQAGGSVSFVLTTTDSSGLYLGSSESANVPVLEVTTSSSGTPPPPSPSADTQPPSAPTGLSLSGASANSLSLAWSAASDNVAVAGYELYLNGSKVGTTSATSYGFSGLACGTSYTLAVAAYDAAGNRSPQASVLASTSPCADTLAPTTPGPLLQTGAGESSISLSWAPALDNVGVAGYGVYLDGSRVGTTAFTSYTLGNLACGRSYTLAVDAYDAAGNRSAQAAVVAATAPCTLAHASFTPVADTYSAQINPDGPHGSLPYLRVAGPNGPIRNSYLRFDLRGLSGTITQATLKLYPSSGGSSSGIDLHAETDNGWQEASLTWNNAPAFASTVSASSGAVSVGSWLALDVTALVQGAGGGSVSFVLTQNDWNSLDLGSRESANAPVLEVTTSGGSDAVPPAAPTGLSLSNASASSLTLSWSAASDNVAVAGYELYLNGSKVGTTSATSYGFSGLACGTSYTLAVAAYDAAGNRSPRAALPAATAACALPTGSGKAPGTGIMAFGGTTALTFGTHAGDYSYVIGGADYLAYQNVPGKSLTYEDGTTLNTDFSSGVPYTEANANGWLLRDASGNYFHPYRDSTRYLADIGNAAYRQRFVDITLALLAAHPGLDGIEIDNVLPDVAYFSTCSCWPAKYPNATAWQDGQVDFVRAVGQAIKAKGYYVMINATGYTNRSDYDSGGFAQTWWARLAQSGGVSGIFYEYFMQDANNLTRLMDDSAPGSYMHSWAGWQKLVAVAQNNGVDFFGITQGPSLLVNPAKAGQLMRYGRGSFLLDWNGSGGMFGYAVSPAYVSGIDPWSSLWTTSVGTPAGAKYQVGTNVWRRDYSSATVIVNPTLSSFTTTLNGASYTVGPTDALILPK